MEYIKLNDALIYKFFGDMDPDCLEEVKELAAQGAMLDPITGEIIINNIKTGIFTDYFTKEF